MWFIITLRSLEPALGQHRGINQNNSMAKHYEVKVTIPLQHKALKASLWDYVNLSIPFPFTLRSRNILHSKVFILAAEMVLNHFKIWHLVELFNTEMNCLGHPQSEEQRAQHKSLNTWKPNYSDYWENGKELRARFGFTATSKTSGV